MKNKSSRGTTGDRRTSLPALILLLALACSQAISAPIDARIDQPIEIPLGETARVENSTVAVRFTGASDSRCPSDVVCVRAGEAAITLLLSGAGAERTDVVYVGKEPKATSYGTYRFEAVDLVPYPRSQGQGTDKTLTLRITRSP